MSRPLTASARHLRVVVGAGVAATMTVLVVVLIAAGVGYDTVLVSVLVVLMAADLAYAWRTNRWRASVDLRTAAAFARMADRHAELRENLARVEAALAEERLLIAAGVRANQDVLLELRLDRVRAASGLSSSDPAE